MEFVVAVVVIGAGLYAWHRTRLDDGRTPPVWDCGRDGCQFRGKATHRHQAA